MSYVKFAIETALYTPWLLTDAQRRFCGDLDELREKFGVTDPTRIEAPTDDPRDTDRPDDAIDPIARAWRAIGESAIDDMTAF